MTHSIYLLDLGINGEGKPVARLQEALQAFPSPVAGLITKFTREIFKYEL